MVILCAPHFKSKIDVARALEIALVHDICEIITGDLPFFEVLNPLDKQKKNLDEERAMSQIRDSIDGEMGQRIYEYWHEYQKGESPEAKFVCALDKLEAQIQQNEADISTWNEFEKLSIFNHLDPFCDYDDFLALFKVIVRRESVEKLKSFQNSQV